MGKFFLPDSTIMIFKTAFQEYQLHFSGQSLKILAWKQKEEVEVEVKADAEAKAEALIRFFWKQLLLPASASMQVF